MSTGKVWLVGAGPGDAGLLTIKGANVLARAEVVVYDSLVGDGVLAMVPESAQRINVGKRSGNHTMPQEEINQVLLEEARKGLRVVRLKGGDPFLFGRGGEELELLTEAGIPYEVVPGVTSCIAVPAYNGIPVTHRDFCSSVHVITGHKKAGEVYDIDFKALKETKGTLVFLMGLKALPDICRGLLEAGMDPAMPAAVLQQGTTAGQRRVVATVADLPEAAQKAGICTPAIIVVGKVCSLAERFGWYEKLPLAGVKAVVTRPRKLVSSMAEKLRTLGAEVLELPAISVEPVKDRQRVLDCLARLEEYQWLVFTSPSGVDIFFDEFLRKMQKDVRALGSMKIAALGGGTARALKARGIFPDLMPQTYDGASLGQELARVCEPNAKILLPRAAIGNREILEALAARPDLVVEDLATYDTVYHTQDLIDEAGEFARGEISCTVFTSASTVRGFANACPDLDFTKVKAACIGRQTCQAARQLGMTAYTAEKATVDSVVELVIRLKAEGNI